MNLTGFKRRREIFQGKKANSKKKRKNKTKGKKQETRSLGDIRSNPVL